MEANKPSLSDASPSKEKSKQGKGQFTNSDQLVFYNEQLSRVEEEELVFQPIYRSMAALTFLDANNNINTGSGVLISKDIVLTAAQNIFNKELHAENSDFKIYVGANGEAEEFYQVEAWKYPQQFETCEQSAKLPHNYAIMKLKKPVDQNLYFSLSLACKECLLRGNKETAMNVFGFPCAYPPDAFGNVRSFEDNFKPLDASGKRMKLHQYGLAREGRIMVVEAEQSKIGYEISTLPGQSGCPVLANGNIIAVHMGGDKAQFNVGRIVDASFINRLWKWREELNAAPFQLGGYNVCQHVEPTLKKMGYKLNLSAKELKIVDLRGYGNLLELYLFDNKLRQIDLAHCPRLTTLNLSRNQLQRIDISNNKHLIQLYLGTNKLQEMDVRNNVNLTYLYLDYNKLQEMDVRNNVNLIQLDLSCNQLKEIEVRANINLTYINLSSNRIAEIDLTTNTKLEWLQLYMNRLARVRLCISENVQEEKIISGKFSLSNQQSAVCRVQLLCEGQGQATRAKAIRIVDIWMQQYSGNQYNNRDNCAYSFLAF